MHDRTVLHPTPPDSSQIAALIVPTTQPEEGDSGRWRLYSYPESLDLSVNAYVEALRQDRLAPVSGEDGRAAIRLDAAALAQSARTGRTGALNIRP